MSRLVDTVVEHMTHPKALENHAFQFSAVPVKTEAFGSFPVRVFSLLED